MKRSLFLAILAAALPTAVNAQLVTNGGFENNGGNGQLGVTTSATGWSIPGGAYTFLFNPQSPTISGTSADNDGANGEYGFLALWGPGNGSANGMTLSPTGGAFIAQDSSFQPGAVSQTINGLNVGATYVLSFDWAAAQQYNFFGPTYDQWQVSLGSQTQNTATVNLNSQAFSGWMHQSFDYTATSSSETLSFLAVGGPNGSVPPFALLDSVSLQAVPEAGTGAAMMFGVVGFGLFARRRAKNSK